jgi:hypothetical protein
LDGSTWRDARLSHDWSIQASSTHENTGGLTAFLPGGIGWHRKTFALPADHFDIVRVKMTTLQPCPWGLGQWASAQALLQYSSM